MTELNPLLEAMNNIDENILANSQKKSRHSLKIKIAVVSAAAAVAALSGTVVAVNYSRRLTYTTEDKTFEPVCSSYVDDRGNKIETYVLDIPEYALLLEKEGYTSTGELKCEWVPEKDYTYQLADENGRVFPFGVNNKAVLAYITPSDGSEPFQVAFHCANLNLDKYNTYENIDQYGNAEFFVGTYDEMKEHGWQDDGQ